VKLEVLIMSSQDIIEGKHKESTEDEGGGTRVNHKKEEVLHVFGSYTIVHPRTMMVHLQE
jgi:hypothetical protein